MTAEVLRVIASSPTDLNRVLDAVAESAATLCDAPGVGIHRVDGDHLLNAGGYLRHGAFPYRRNEQVRRANRFTVTGRAFVDRELIHVHDLQQAAENDFPESRKYQGVAGHRAIVAVPLMLKDAAIGTITAFRYEPVPFAEAQLTLLKTFADQAVIAIENARLFEELQESNRQVAAALEQQTVMAEVLRVIASSPASLQQVLSALIASVTRLCDSDAAVVARLDGDEILLVAASRLPVA